MRIFITTFFLALSWSLAANARTMDQLTTLDANRQLRQCPYWGGGIESDLNAEQWTQDGFRVEFAHIMKCGRPETEGWHYREQWLEKKDGKIAVTWSDWHKADNPTIVGTRLYFETVDGMWDLQIVDAIIYGRLLVEPIYYDPWTREFQTSDPRKTYPIRLICIPEDMRSIRSNCTR